MQKQDTIQSRGGPATWDYKMDECWYPRSPVPPISRHSFYIILFSFHSSICLHLSTILPPDLYIRNTRKSSPPQPPCLPPMSAFPLPFSD